MHWHEIRMALLAGGVATVVGGIFAWFYLNRKEWQAGRRVKRERDIDARAIATLQDRNLWRSPRPTTDDGWPLLGTKELAIYLKLDQDAVAESLGRLERSGKVAKEAGRARWHSIEH
jgi:hypothetical protein